MSDHEHMSNNARDHAGWDLPASYGDDLRRIDGLLTAHASRRQLPVGLNDRVFELSAPRLLRTSPTYSFAAAHRRQRTLMSRLAMAASIALAFLVGRTVVNMPSDGPMMADGGNGSTPMTIQPLAMAAPLSADAEWVLMESAGNGARDLSMMPDVRNATYADLTRDLEIVVDELEM